ncbi:PREDICTED: cingulin-like [Wasmannia auropunctata]|uniref:cingulin-like n=1 Tax=Wasmannia auropunctata TaxID=64793 RepID=UPI0005EE64C6|nr:PREDICTED: cingulin-like [Wasmannia auropunctata]
MLSPTPPIDRSSLCPGTGYLIAPRVPHGLATVVEGLTREVLRHRPEDIYIFAARHFEKLLKLREEYHVEEYCNREFSHECSRDFNLWPAKATQNIRKLSNGGWSLEKEIEIFERREQVAADAAEESQEDVSTDRESKKTSRQTCSKGPATTKKTSKRSKDNETTSDARATRIISQMTALHGPGKNIQAKDIKQELRKNKLSGEKSKAADSVEKGIRGDRRPRTRVSKTDKGSVEEVERATTTTTTTSSRTSARRPLKKVRRIETESETETEREVAAKVGLEDAGRARSSREEIARTESRERKSETRFSEHSSARKVSSRALSMDRIRAYVLRKFASTASLEVLRSPTYVEQVQEVIDRAAPIIKEKLEEIGRPRGKRSRSVELAWNEESFPWYVREERRHGDEEESGRNKSGSGLERKVDIVKKEEMKDSLGRNETIPTVEKEEKKSRRRSVGSGKKSRRRESGDFGVVDQVDDNSKHSNMEHESGATRDTLEARLTATQSILEGISKSTSELGGARRSDPAGNEPSESEVSDHINVVSLPVVRPPSSRNSRSAAKNGSDSLTLPPISPEAPKSTKKKDELSLPVLSTAATNNGNHSARKLPQEQDVSKDAEEASTMHDITSDIEDIAVLPENGHEDAIIDVTQDSGSDLLSVNKEEGERDEDVDKIFDDKRGSLEEFEELEKFEEGKRSEVFRDSLNVTPEVADVPLRPDSLEPDENEVKLQDDNADPVRENTFDRLKDKLIEIEMAERSIEKALACQQVATCDIGEMTSQVEKSVTDGKINEAEKPTNEAEETVSEIRKSTDVGKIPINKNGEEGKKNYNDEKRKSMNEEIKNVAEISNKTEDLNIDEKLTNKAEKMESEIEGSTDKIKNLTNKTETTNGIENLTIENEAEGLKSKGKILKNGGKAIDQEEVAVKIHVKNLQSANPRSHGKDSQITEAVETDGDNAMTSKKKTENTTNGFSKSATSGSAAIKSESSNLPNESSSTKARKKRESDKLVMTPLSLELPYSYVLSEGSPCEIPDSVTTVIIPDRSCLSPVTLEDEDYQLDSTNKKKESFARFDMAKEISKDERQEKDQHEYGMEVFGEYIRPDSAGLPIDTDFMRGAKGMKPSQDITIVHQDLDRIKEEGEEEEEKEERKETEIYQEKKNDEEKNVKEEEVKKVSTLEDIVEHEENEEIDVRTIGSKDAEEITSSDVLEYESLPDTRDLTIDTSLPAERKADVGTDSRSLLENSSEESGSTQGTHTTTSSDAKESTVSNRSIESPSPGRPVVPELNLDSLQDNTVSSFKMTANGTEKEDNGSPKESDATSLVEPLISDERLMNRLIDYEEEIVAEKLTERDLQSEAPEADQLYRAEHVEYEWLEKDPLSEEINLENETIFQEGSIDSKALPEDAVRADLLLPEKAEAEELGSEEEIARELIGSLDKDMQLRAEELNLKKESVDTEKSEKDNLEIDDKSNQPQLLSASMHSMLVEREKKEHEDSLDKTIKIEAASELSGDVTNISQDSTIIDKETGKVKSEMTKKAHIEKVAPLAEFEQDKLLEENGSSETVDERIIIDESKPNIIDTDHTVIHEKFEDKQTSIKEVPESQSSDSKIEESNRKQEKNELEELQNQKKHDQEKLEVHEECKQEKIDIQEEIEQEKLKIQDKDDKENVEIEEQIVSVRVLPLETESRKSSINELMKNVEHEEIKPDNESIIEDQTGKDVKNEKEEKSEDLSGKVESVHGPITSAISEHSVEDHSRFGYWTTMTKSSTVETVIEAFNSNTSTDEKADIAADAPEIIADESLIQRKDDFHSAVIKIQACIRGFLARRRVRRSLNSEFISNIVPSTRKTDRLVVPQDTSNLREGRRLRREEALRNTTLSLENAFATGRLQHTGEFHDSVPLLPFDLTNKTDSVTSNDSLDEEINVEEANPPDIAKSSDKLESEPVRDSEHRTNFHKGNAFVDPTFPIMMHLLTDASRRFAVGQNSHSGFNPSTGGANPMEPTVDILMLGYPRDDENQYLNFITSVEDLNSNMDSLTLDDVTRSAKNTDDARLSTTSGEGSLMEPLALSGVSQGVVIEEMTSLDELVPSESTKPSTAPKTSLDTNSSMPSEECAPEDTKDDLGVSASTTDATEDRKQAEAEGQESARNLETVGESDLRSEDANKESNEISRDRREHVEGEDDKT